MEDRCSMSQRSCSVRCRFFDVLRDQRDTDTEAPSPSMAPVVPAFLPGGPPASKIARNAGKGCMLSYLGMCYELKMVARLQGVCSSASAGAQVLAMASAG
jgi:hypothetical protein